MNNHSKMRRRDSNSNQYNKKNKKREINESALELNEEEPSEMEPSPPKLAEKRGRRREPAVKVQKLTKTKSLIDLRLTGKARTGNKID